MHIKLLMRYVACGHQKIRFLKFGKHFLRVFGTTCTQILKREEVRRDETVEMCLALCK